MPRDERFYERLLDETPALICTFLADSTLTFVNRAYCECFGRDADDLVGRRFLDLIPDLDQRQAAREQFLSLTPDRPSVSYEHLVVNKDGRERWQRWTDRVYFDDDGNVEYYQALGQDITERRLMEDKLHARQRLLHIAGRMADIGGWEWSAELGRFYWSNEVCAIYDVPPGTEPGLDEALSFVAPGWRNRARLVFIRCTGEGVPFDEEMRIMTARGDDVWVRAIGQPVRDGTGSIVRVQGAVQNIAKKKEADEQVRRLAVRLKDTLESIADGFVTLDRGGRFTFINQRAGKYFQKPRSELIGTSSWLEFFDLVGEGFEPQCRRAAIEAISTGFDVYAPRLESWLGIRIHPTEEGIAVGIQDITRQKRLTAELQESRERYRRLHEGIRDVVFRLSRAGTLNTLNSAFDRLTGWSRKHWVGKRFTELVHVEDVEKVREMLACGLNGDEVPDFEVRMIAAEETEIPVELTVTPEIVNDAVVGLMGIAHDIRARCRLEERIRQMQKLDSIGRLVGGIAHDFNNFLMVMQGYVAMLADEPGMSSEALKTLFELDRTVERGSMLTRQLLLFSRKQVMHIGPMNLDETIESTSRMFRRILGEDIHLDLRCGTGNINIRGDLDMVEQVLMNLVVNARDAMPDGGSLVLETRMVDVGAEARVRNPEAREGRFVRLRVADTGIGMDQHTPMNIYKPFFTTKEGGDGTGLGLPTVYGILRQHGGWIEADSQVNGGSEFQVYLPVCEDSVDTEIALNAQGTELAGHGECILLVEDDASVRNMLGESLESMGYQVILADCGPRAVQEWNSRRGEIDLLITDVVMPGGMTGWQLTSKLLKDKPSLKAVVISGYSFQDTVESWAVDRGIPFIRKPCSPRQMARTIRECLGG